MELHPIVDQLTDLKPNLWYVLSPNGEGPSVRVGHTCLFLGGKKDDPQDNKGQILIIGGANPDGSFNDVFSIDIDNTLKWTKKDSKGLLPRYEHSAFAPTSCPGSVVVFGGGQIGENLNDVQELDTVQEGSWSTVTVNGEPPSGRTCHSMTSVEDNLYVFGGGYRGSEPVPDQTMHVYNAVTKTWSKIEAKGDIPSSRHGHIMVAIETDIFLHGGLAGTSVFDDLYKFNTVDSTWCKLLPSGDIPDGRTAHAGTAINKYLYIFGGMSGMSASLDDFYRLDTETLCWHKIKIDALPPNPRLDHAMCTITITQSLDEKSSTESEVNKKVSKLIFIFGGMDTSGEILNDCFVFLPGE